MIKPDMGPDGQLEDMPLRICRQAGCLSFLVKLVEASPQTDDQWLVSLQCPECKGTDSRIVSAERLDSFDRESEMRRLAS